MLTSYIIQRIISSYYMIYSIISCILNARELVHLHRMHERQNLPAHRATDAKHLDFGVIIPQINPLAKKNTISAT